ncbi:DNA polymerase III subunit gamma/tau [Alkalihalobacillus oceani]|uniref:DNA polymerase III subunit gamma/tau n=1 Tax=Halalkalibacter oceani TaxID=1653776 RepID=UPI00203ECE43|nr:DNA polymerase III subunit gamma/tau [Halalkalibacter oceani]
MGYQALYRVWRPQLLKDVVGQEHITRTLQNALLQEKLSHAYLFSGPRGTGKTSAAKIIAKAINCQKAPVAEPCNECPACIGITNGSIVDVMEIDAASNNGVDEIRDIRDKVKFAPNEVRYKVYIIDEVHMLSTGAFNALLKTLEEPPSHVLFILATTEPHKIPLTIISRCQRFDFKRITSQAIVARLAHILEHDGVAFEEDALLMIARAAEGGMRDALSLLDQAISFADESLTLADVLAVTGAVSQHALQVIVEAIHAGETVKVLEQLDQLLQDGKDPLRLIEDTVYYFRDMLLYKHAPQAEELLERAKPDEVFQRLAAEVDEGWLYRAIDSLNKSQQEMKGSAHPKIFLELALMKLVNQKVPRQPAQAPTAAVASDEVEQLKGKIQTLERAFEQLKQSGGAEQGKEQTTAPAQRRPKKVPAQARMSTAKVKETIKDADKRSLQQVTASWGDVMERIKSQSVPAHAWLMDSKPVAASASTIVLAFQNEMHRDMMDTKFRAVLEQILQEALQGQSSFVTILQHHWEQVKQEFVHEQKSGDEEENDTLIDEAIKLVGEELIEIVDG